MAAKDSVKKLLREPSIKRSAIIIFSVALVIGTLFILVGFFTERGEATVFRYEGNIAAPDFPRGMEWLNTEEPFSIRDFRGKVVLLDFWTYCCINCIHVIPDLKRLEKKYPDELVVIGVHSAKFFAERETENIRQAILRYEIEHPVINDRDMVVWRTYGVRAWPTLVLIDPDGKVIGTQSGEGAFALFDPIISEVIAEFDKRGRIDRTPLDFVLEREKTAPSPLKFPGKILADEGSGRLFVSDSNHNRIVVLSLEDGSIIEVVGSGEMGFSDSDFMDASFNHPQGMALSGDILYVADTENHAIRTIDLKARTVTTVAGIGEQARTFNTAGPGETTALNSPWDVVFHDGALYIAMAGSHQLHRLDRETGYVSPYAGSGREARLDGPLSSAALAQPSGITTDGKRLYFADSEVSAIRSADLDPTGDVVTIVGGDLFDFGDRDGKGLDARLQHPLGVAYHRGYLYVADTYNNKIKRISLADNRIETILGSGEAGFSDGRGTDATFDEPSGVSVAGGKLYIADTNNHAVRVADLETLTVTTLEIGGERESVPAGEEEREDFFGEHLELTPQEVVPGDVTLVVSLDFPDGYKLNKDAPSSVVVRKTGENPPAFSDGGKDESERAYHLSSHSIEIPLILSGGKTEITVDYVIYYCEAENPTLCLFKEARLVLPITAKEGADSATLSVDYELSLP
jgi:DNA-binding beta-propeller fold protein YncE